MYIEVTHDADGNIGSCYCVDSLPNQTGEPLFTVKNMPVDKEQVRIIIDTLTAMEIDQNAGQKAVINAAGSPEIITIDRTDYIRQNFKVDMTQEIPKPMDLKISDKLKLRKLIRR